MKVVETSLSECKGSFTPFRKHQLKLSGDGVRELFSRDFKVRVFKNEDEQADLSRISRRQHVSTLWNPVKPESVCCRFGAAISRRLRMPKFE